jgi:Fe-S-cluster-containing dehydrogenase component/formate-dependent nitrite reductase membrane component NrfD
MQYGFIIDNRKCIGCHACTVACKTENQVPIGVNRTWVKYVEKGRFPNTRRYFQVTRCNHCENPPCVEICPVTAMFQRRDGIVDFDPEACIGCKACMQACPYDAIYIDPERHTAAKCNYCAHRTEVGLEPACVTVCPEQAIIAGDLENPYSNIAQLLDRHTVRVRSPEKGTKPKLYYIEAEESAIIPTAARHEPFYMWSERNQQVHGGGAAYPPDSPLLRDDVLAAYDVSHARPWGWQVPAYLWTKSMASATLALPALAAALGKLALDPMRDAVLAVVALVFTALTLVLLVWDLDQKARFLRVLLRPQSRSWLARGAFVLMGYSGLCALVLAASLAHAAIFPAVLLGPTVIAGFFAAIYTAFLFGQCKGRDLWQTSLLPVHLLVQTVLSGAAVLIWLPPWLGGSPPARSFGTAGLAISLALHLLILLAEFSMPHATDNARYAARLITHGPYRLPFWWGAVVLGGIVPVLLLCAGAAAAAGVLALAGLFAFEWCFVMAGQSVPNS